MERLVVGIDGSAASREAANWAARLAEQYGAALHLVCVVENPSTWVGMGAAMSASVVDALSDDDLRAAGQIVVDRILEESDIQGAVTSEVLIGYPAQQLCTISRDASLLVVGANGHRIKSALIGSVALHCAHHSSCPVVIMPRVS